VCYIHGDTSAQNQIDIGSGKGFFRSLLGVPLRGDEP
jgi:hypothetical protein